MEGRSLKRSVLKNECSSSASSPIQLTCGLCKARNCKIKSAEMNFKEIEKTNREVAKSAQYEIRGARDKTEDNAKIYEAEKIRV